MAVPPTLAAMYCVPFSSEVIGPAYNRFARQFHDRAGLRVVEARFVPRCAMNTRLPAGIARWWREDLRVSHTNLRVTDPGCNQPVWRVGCGLPDDGVAPAMLIRVACHGATVAAHHVCVSQVGVDEAGAD